MDEPKLRWKPYWPVLGLAWLFYFLPCMKWLPDVVNRSKPIHSLFPFAGGALAIAWIATEFIRAVAIGSARSRLGDVSFRTSPLTFLLVVGGQLFISLLGVWISYDIVLHAK